MPRLHRDSSSRSALPPTWPAQLRCSASLFSFAIGEEVGGEHVSEFEPLLSSTTRHDLTMNSSGFNVHGPTLTLESAVAAASRSTDRRSHYINGPPMPVPSSTSRDLQRHPPHLLV